MELFEADIMTKLELQQRIAKTNEQLEQRLQLIRLQLQTLKEHIIHEVTIQEVMVNFQKTFKQAMIQE